MFEAHLTPNHSTEICNGHRQDCTTLGGYHGNCFIFDREDLEAKVEKHQIQQECVFAYM